MGHVKNGASSPNSTYGVAWSDRILLAWKRSVSRPTESRPEKPPLPMRYGEHAGYAYLKTWLWTGVGWVTIYKVRTYCLGPARMSTLNGLHRCGWEYSAFHEWEGYLMIDDSLFKFLTINSWASGELAR